MNSLSLLAAVRKPVGEQTEGEIQTSYFQQITFYHFSKGFNSQNFKAQN